MAKNNAAVRVEAGSCSGGNELQGTAANDGITAGTADMEDGSIFAGTTKDGKQILAMPINLGFTATFNDAAKAVKELNEKKALGHDDWQITDLDTLKVLQRNQNQGSLKGQTLATFSFKNYKLLFKNYKLLKEGDAKDHQRLVEERTRLEVFENNLAALKKKKRPRL